MVPPTRQVEATPRRCAQASGYTRDSIANGRTSAGGIDHIVCGDGMNNSPECGSVERGCRGGLRPAARLCDVIKARTLAAAAPRGLPAAPARPVFTLDQTDFPTNIAP